MKRTAPTELRRRAEEALQAKAAPEIKPTTLETQKLLHELQVHQIELEMQNEELVNAKDALELKNADLRNAKAALEIALSRYIDLYDFAPTGYFTLRRHGEINQVNLAGASILGLERSRLQGCRFGTFVNEATLSVFNSFLRNVFTGLPKPISEVELDVKEQSPRIVRIEGILSADEKECRVVVTDITEKKRNEATIQQQANYDLLTGLPNRQLFRDRLQLAIKGRRDDDKLVVLMFIDLDNFKNTNDIFGHHCGDELLIEAARRIGDCVRDGDTVARLGGDEFTVILSNVDDTERVTQVAQMILREVARPFALTGGLAYVSTSIGIALYPKDAEDIDDLIKNADQAMYQAKKQGRNRYIYFKVALQQAAVKRQQLSNDLHQALAGGQLMVYYQPIIDLATRHCVKAEALLRWRHPLRGLIEPAEFIPLAEQFGLISEIGDWAFREASEQVKAWIALKTDCVQVSVNKSPRQFVEDEKKLDWFAHLKLLDLPPECMNIEITEGLLLDKRHEVTKNLERLRDVGIQIALDDFGTGYSAMSYLKRFSIDYLKIDQSFIRDMVEDASDQAIVDAIIAMAHKLGMKVIAEGVETIEQCDLLVAAGCDLAQGYLFARPMAQHDFVAYLENMRDSDKLVCPGKVVTAKGIHRPRSY